MKGKRYGRKRFWAVIPPWLIIGAVVILVPVFIFMTLENINRQKEQTTRLLVEKGAALIRSFEAGARTGIGLSWGGFQLQKLLMETAEQPDIDYLIVTDTRERSWPTAIPCGSARSTAMTLIWRKSPVPRNPPGGRFPTAKGPIPSRSIDGLRRQEGTPRTFPIRSRRDRLWRRLLPDLRPQPLPDLKALPR